MVGLAVASLVEAVPCGLARGRLDGAGAAQGGERCFAGEPVGVVAGCGEQDRRDVGADAFGGPQRWAGSGGEPVEAFSQLAEIGGEGLVLAGQGAQCELGGLGRVGDVAGAEPGAALALGLRERLELAGAALERSRSDPGSVEMR